MQHYASSADKHFKSELEAAPTGENLRARAGRVLRRVGSGVGGALLDEKVADEVDQDAREGHHERRRRERFIAVSVAALRQLPDARVEWQEGGRQVEEEGDELQVRDPESPGTLGEEEHEERAEGEEAQDGVGHIDEVDGFAAPHGPEAQVHDGEGDEEDDGDDFGHGQVGQGDVSRLRAEEGSHVDGQ